MTAGATASIVQALRAFFAVPPPGTVAVYLFGSVARGVAGPRSDLDVAVLFDDDPPRTLEGLQTELGERLQEAIGRPVDLVVLNHAPADLIHRVLRDSVLINEENPTLRVAFEVRSRNEYFDLAPIRERYRRPPATGSTT